MADFWGIQKSIKKCTPKVWHMVPTGCPNGVTFGAKSRANSRKKAGPYFWPSQAPFWVAFWTCFGTFLTMFWYIFDDFWPHFLYIFSWCARSVFQTLRHILSRTWPRSRRRRGRKPHGMHRKVLCSCGFCWELFLTCSLSLRASRSPVRKGSLPQILVQNPAKNNYLFP